MSYKHMSFIFHTGPNNTKVKNFSKSIFTNEIYMLVSFGLLFKVIKKVFKFLQ